jgi:hypothetical protein
VRRLDAAPHELLQLAEVHLTLTELAVAATGECSA